MILNTQHMPNTLSSADTLFPFQMEKYDPTHEHFFLKFQPQSDEIPFVLFWDFKGYKTSALEQFWKT